MPFGRSYALGYVYDVNGKVTQITYPSGRIINIARATDGKVTAVTMKATSSSGAVNVATGVTYAPFGPLTSLTYGNGLSLTRTYDQNFWLNRIQVNNSATALLDLSYSWFDDGRLNAVTDNASTGRTEFFNYTNAGQLSYAVGPWGTEVYGYDAAGNRTGAYTTLSGATTTDNEITSGSSNLLTQTQDANANVLRSLTYRAGGDLSQDQHTDGATFSYLYNAHKRLVEVENNGTQVGGYFYDAFGRRVIRGTTAGDVEYVFDPAGHLLAEHNGDTGAVQKEYVWIDDLPVAVVDSTSGTAATYYIHTGEVDEPQMLTDSTQSVAWTAYVKPYGLAQLFRSPAATTLDLRLPSQWLQLETNGLYQNGMRDYDPSLGRYIEADPLGIDAGQNIYAYVDGDPLDANDPLGLMPISQSDQQTLGRFFPPHILNNTNITVLKWTPGDFNFTIYNNVFINKKYYCSDQQRIDSYAHELVHVEEFESPWNMIDVLKYLLTSGYDDNPYEKSVRNINKQIMNTIHPH